MRVRYINKLLTLGIATLLAFSASAERVKDLASVDGVRPNQLVGYGLVVGLPGSGDQTTQTQFTVQSLKSTLARLGVIIPENINPQLKNVAAVLVHAELPAFGKAGQTIASDDSIERRRWQCLCISTRQSHSRWIRW